MRDIFFYTIGVSFACGIFIRSFFDVGQYEILFVLFLSITLALLWRFASKTFYSLFFLLSLSLFAVAFGMFRLDVIEKASSIPVSSIGETTTIEGVVVREPDIRQRTMQLYVYIDQFDETVLLIGDRFRSVSYGDRIIAEGIIEEPTSFETDLGRIFNYPGFLKARSVETTMLFPEITVVKSGEGNSVLRALLSFKHSFMERLERVVVEPQVGLGEGLLLGVKRALGEELEAVFRSTGIIHIVVLSGYNVMLVAEAIMRFLSFFFVPRIRIVIGIVAITSFALLVGLSATVVRASIMASLVLIARATGRVNSILRALVLAGAVMLLINPYLLAFDPGFQLSFLATLGLILLAPLIEVKLHLAPTTFQIREFITATIATQIMVLPLLLYLIGEFSVVAVLVNVLVLPAVPFAMFFTFIAGMFALISTSVGIFIGFFAHLFLSYIITVATIFAALPFSSVSIPTFSFMFVILAYFGIGFFIWYLKRKPKQDAITKSKNNQYADWTIVELKNLKEELKTLEAQNAPSVKATKNDFPFR